MYEIIGRWKNCWGVAIGSVSTDCKDDFVEMTEVEEGFLVAIVGVIICTSRVVKMKEDLHLGNSPYFLLKKELLLTVMSSTEEKRFFKTQVFDC